MRYVTNHLRETVRKSCMVFLIAKENHANDNGVKYTQYYKFIC